MKADWLLVTLGIVLAASSSLADERHHREQLTEGEVRKLDQNANRITLKHGPIQSLDMPAMTMVFRVKDRAMLDKIKAGDRVLFSVEKIGDTYTVTRIEPKK